MFSYNTNLKLQIILNLKKEYLNDYIVDIFCILVLQKITTCAYIHSYISYIFENKKNLQDI